MRVLLADDEPKVRSALRLILEQLNSIDSVDEVVNARDLSDRLHEGRPDLLLVDWELPGLHPSKVFSEIRSGQPLKVIVLSGRCQIQNAALACGADAFVSKCESPD